MKMAFSPDWCRWGVDFGGYRSNFQIILGPVTLYRVAWEKGADGIVRHVREVTE